MNTKNCKSVQQGSTLIELMVALGISSFLLLGIVQIYTDNHKNNNFQEGQATNQENTRFTLLVFEQQLKKAGFRRETSGPIEDYFLADTYPGCTAFRAGEVVTPAVAVDANETGICLRYQPAANGEQDCLGTIVPGVPASASAPSNTTVVSRITYLPAKGTLQCQTYDLAKNISKGEMLTGIVDLRIEAGIGKTGNIEKTIESYVALDTAAIAAPIRALRYTALLRSDDNLTFANENKTRDRWTAIYPDSLISIRANDHGNIYQIAQGHQTIRNLMP